METIKKRPVGAHLFHFYPRYSPFKVDICMYFYLEDNTIEKFVFKSDNVPDIHGGPFKSMA